LDAHTADSGQLCEDAGASDQATYAAIDATAVTTPARRFPPPWSIEDIGAAFVVKDGGSKAVSLAIGAAAHRE
jgi:hypothetical protein